MRRLLTLAAVSAGVLAFCAPASAAPLAISGPNTASDESPFAPGCGGPGEAAPSSVNYLSAEVESHVADDPTDAVDARRGLAAGPLERWRRPRQRARLLHRRRRDLDRELAALLALRGRHRDQCRAGHDTAPRPSDYERATDPWVSYGPGGRLHAVALVFDNSTPRNAVLAAYSDDDGATWSAPRELRFDNPRALGNNFNDKETLTADPGDPDYVYATWQRIVSPSEGSSAKAYENSVSYFSDAWFVRSIDGGETWEPARSIFHPGRFQQTIGNQIEVLPDADGTLINGFNRIQAISNRARRRGYNVEVMRSPDKGETWSAPVHVDRLLVDEVADPDVAAPCPDRDADGTCPVRTGDIIPDFAVDRGTNLATRGNLYAVWMDTRFNDPDHNDILLSRSTNGGTSWEEPVIVDQTPEGVDAFTATVDVDGTGRVAVSYYDFRNDEIGDDELTTDFWVAHSHDGGQSFPDEDQLTTDSFDMRTAPFALGYFVGDYTGLSHFDDRFDSLWVGANDGDEDNRTDVFHQSAE